jgi:hypothetical protein
VKYLFVEDFTFVREEFLNLYRKGNFKIFGVERLNSLSSNAKTVVILASSEFIDTKYHFYTDFFEKLGLINLYFIDYQRFYNLKNLLDDSLISALVLDAKLDGLDPRENDLILEYPQLNYAELKESLYKPLNNLILCYHGRSYCGCFNNQLERVALCGSDTVQCGVAMNCYEPDVRRIFWRGIRANNVFLFSCQSASLITRFFDNKYLIINSLVGVKDSVVGTKFPVSVPPAVVKLVYQLIKTKATMAEICYLINCFYRTIFNFKYNPFFTLGGGINQKPFLDQAVADQILIKVKDAWPISSVNPQIPRYPSGAELSYLFQEGVWFQKYWTPCYSFETSELSRCPVCKRESAKNIYKHPTLGYRYEYACPECAISYDSPVDDFNVEYKIESDGKQIQMECRFENADSFGIGGSVYISLYGSTDHDSVRSVPIFRRKIYYTYELAKIKRTLCYFRLLLSIGNNNFAWISIPFVLTGEGEVIL